MKKYIFMTMIGLSVSAMGMDRTLIVPQGLREGTLIKAGSDYELVSYLKLAHKPSIADWVVVRDADSNNQYVWATIVAAKKELQRQSSYTISYSYTVVQKRNADGLQLRREIPLEQLNALVMNSYRTQIRSSSDKENENSMDFHWFYDQSNQ